MLIKKDGVERLERVERKNFVLNNATKLYNEWINRYRADYDKESEDKDSDWRGKYDYKNFDNLAAPQLAPKEYKLKKYVSMLDFLKIKNSIDRAKRKNIATSFKDNNKTKNFTLKGMSDLL